MKRSGNPNLISKGKKCTKLRKIINNLVSQNTSNSKTVLEDNKVKNVDIYDKDDHLVNVLCWNEGRRIVVEAVSK